MTFGDSNMDMQKHEIATIAEKNRVVTRILDAFTQRSSFLIIGHQSPDEDCIASMVAVGLLLSKMQKRVLICTATEIPVHFRYLLEI
ncbi:MAG: DHH family protein, partial [Spirochaetaceae bacterium]